MIDQTNLCVASDKKNSNQNVVVVGVFPWHPNASHVLRYNFNLYSAVVDALQFFVWHIFIKKTISNGTAVIMAFLAGKVKHYPNILYILNVCTYCKNHIAKQLMEPHYSMLQSMCCIKIMQLFPCISVSWPKVSAKHRKKNYKYQLGWQIEKLNFIGISHNKASPDSIYYTLELNRKASRLHLIKLYQEWGQFTNAAEGEFAKYFRLKLQLSY